MVEADEVASSQGLHDETFAVVMPNGGGSFVQHTGFGGERPLVSKRALLGLREAGLFTVESETGTSLASISPRRAATACTASADRR